MYEKTFVKNLDDNEEKNICHLGTLVCQEKDDSCAILATHMAYYPLSIIKYKLSLSNRYLLHEQRCRGKIWKVALMVILVIMIDHDVCFFQVSKIKSHLQAESVACMLAILAWISWNSPASKIFQYSRKVKVPIFYFGAKVIWSLGLYWKKWVKLKCEIWLIHELKVK